MSKQILQETIFAGIYVIPRGELRNTSVACRRQHRKVRRPRHCSMGRRTQIPNRAPIALRPLEVEIRIILGHWGAAAQGAP